VVEEVVNGGIDIPSTEWIRMGRPQATLGAGRQTPGALASLDLQERVVLYMPPVDADSAEQTAVVQALYARSAGGRIATRS
jgi:hypothetical protein